MTTSAREEHAPVHAGGTIWRLRSLVAMGHDGTRIARALDVRPESIGQLLRAETATVSPGFRDLACRLWDTWWDKRPPERTRAERRAATAARRRAERHGWCTPAALDEEQLDEPGYRPYARYRPATGTGVAADFRPPARPANRAQIAWALSRGSRLDSPAFTGTGEMNGMAASGQPAQPTLSAQRASRPAAAPA